LAVKWYRKAAEQGDVKAQANLGLCYYNGKGVGQNYKEAARWCLKAAEMGHAKAQYNLGMQRCRLQIPQAA
jgi:TPR repeat protein